MMETNKQPSRSEKYTNYAIIFVLAIIACTGLANTLINGDKLKDALPTEQRDKLIKQYDGYQPLILTNKDSIKILNSRIDSLRMQDKIKDKVIQVFKQEKKKDTTIVFEEK